MTRDPSPVPRSKSVTHAPRSTAPRFGIVSAIKYQKRDTLRASVFVDGEFSFGIHVPTIERFRLRKGDEIDSILFEKITIFDQTISARRIAQKYLNVRRRSERDVRRKLHDEGISEQLIDAAIEEMKQVKLIDDLAYAQAFIHDRLLAKSISKGKLALELQAKGVDRHIANEALQGIANDDDELQRAMTAAEKKLPSLDRKSSDPRIRSQKLYAFLAGRGFTGSIIRKTLEQLGQPAEEGNAE